ncbi:nucleic acid/nucleotide deaminase domain-containing protein [Streptomyces sp. LaPpAH-108]|uniref:nucleic acid/nucleotide deaminase domain-containing protein n=1 Tax=Streptomyces sp. LaPpAH-108 TaxID=1155714 RepID=UPI00036008C2|nr:nucleic acid/nucleotide deaminase domain-containing protein [Streptomyces sp. LaPpAH-108]
MGYTLPGWLDDVLDFIGINFPNVDEDDYREMADAMRDFADKFEGHGADAHKSVERILASSHGWAVDSMEKHWNQVKAGHLDKIPELARLFADACDVVADIIFGMKTKAEAELAVMAASVGVTAGLAVVTGGLSALIGAAEVTAMRQLIKRLIDEAVDRIVDELIARVTEPVNAKLEAMIEDAVLNMVDDAFSLPPVPDGDGAHGHHGMKLASAGGGGLSAADLFIDHEEFEHGAGRLSTHGSELRLAGISPLGRAKGAFGRTKGRDAFTQPFDAMLHGALTGCEKAMVKVGKHLRDTIPDRVKATSRLHKGTDLDVEDRVRGVESHKGRDEHGNVRMYILNADGSVDRLMPDGTIPAKGSHGHDAEDRLNLANIAPGGTAWRPKTESERQRWQTPSGHEGKVTSRKVDAATSDLAQATQLARKAHDYYKGKNYAAGRYIDPQSGREMILVAQSGGGFHSERSMGHPLLQTGNASGLKDLFTERAPCQKSPRCERWLSAFFSHTNVTHAADYDQSDPSTQGKEHKAYREGLERLHGKK